MIFDLQQVINSSLSLRLVSSLAQNLPPRWGYRLAYFLADRIASRRESKLVRVLRANQWVVSGQTQERDVLDRMVHDTLRHSAHSLFDLYHYNDNFEATSPLLVLDPSFDVVMRRKEFEGRGLMIAGLHLSSFDLVLQWICRNGLRPLVLTIPDPRGARQIEYQIRKRMGMNLVPASVAALRQALRHLQRGGMVLTGIDRPIENPEVCPRFFGHPSALPIHHIFLAVKAHVPVVITVSYRRPDGKYHVFASEPIEMDTCPDASDLILRNAEKVLGVAEGYILRSPLQWSVPLPVWPETLELAPM
jgi:lauroyl/myristoyl acyltransferase